MEVQWPLVVFTLFICLSSGLLGGLSLLAVKGKRACLYMPGVIVAFVALVIGGLGSFTHLQHWERVFNGFGHVTSGITQEMIGCIVVAVLLIVWFFTLRGKKPVGKPLAWVSLVCAVLMVLVTGHSYFMASRPAWGVGMMLFYLANACMLGGVVLWVLAVFVKQPVAEGAADAPAETAEAPAAEPAGDGIVKLAFIGTATQLVADVLYLIITAVAHIGNFGHYADPTQMTTNPAHIDNLAAFALVSGGAPMFWLSIVTTVVALACAFAFKRKGGNEKLYAGIAAVAALVASVCFRVLIYQMGYPVFLLY